MIVKKNLPHRGTKMFKDIINDGSGGVISFLDAMEEFVILIDPHSNEIFFANAYARKEFPDLEGKCCWKALGYQEPCCYNNSCLYRKTFQVEKEENTWKEHKVTRVSLSHKVLIMESIRDISIKKFKEREKNLRNDLFSMASHELRTPLNIIVSTLQLLEKYNENWQSSDTLKHTRRIKKATTQIDKLLQNILLVGKVQAERIDFNPKPIDVVKLSKLVAEGIQEVKEKSLNIIFSSAKKSLVANADEFILTTILNNLLNNAAKYSKNNGEVKINLELDDRNIIFSVIDQGIGIPEAEQKNLFKSFYRASNTGGIAGTGLGLAIVKDLVGIHKGSIDFTSKENEGTTFTVKIPAEFTTSMC